MKSHNCICGYALFSFENTSLSLIIINILFIAFKWTPDVKRVIIKCGKFCRRTSELLEGNARICNKYFPKKWWLLFKYDSLQSEYKT